MFQEIMNRALRRYEGSDPAIRMRAKLFFLIYLLILVILPVAITYSAWSHLRNPTLGYRLNLLILIPEIMALLPLVLVLILLLRGRFSLSAHLLLVFLFLMIWVIMLLDRSGELSRLDTIVFVLGILTLTPLAIVRHKKIILLYGGINLAAFLLFMLHIRPQLQMPFHRYMEYVFDNAVAIVFITLTAFAVFLINQRALEQMKNELAERRRQEDETKRLQAQLVHALKMESVGRLAGGVAHDFNNLLTMVMGNTSLALAKQDAGSPAAARLKDVMRAAESAASLIRQLLAFSRREAIEPRPLDLNRLIIKITSLLERLLGSDVKPVLKLGAGIGPIMADPSQVEQIVVNLAINARDAMPGGGILTIETRNQRIDSPPALASPVLKPGDYVALSVTDTGIGIPENDLPRIFDPFFTTKPVGQGTGLGLASVYGAVQQNGGAIAVSSAPGKGTVMTVYFPATKLAPRAGEPASRSEDLPGGNEAVLLVEDDAMVLEFIQLVLSGLGYRVQGAADGAGALKLAAAPGARYDLLLTDVILPDMTGTALAAKTLPRLPGARLLYMSAHAENVIVHDGIVDGGVHFIAKPFTAPELARKIRSVLDAPMG
ncbi:MAG: ATP-binding protein [Acidobacteria bacterium]|jgi:signal transduction histidine kinase/CheY-like chemotaxis protein|nr:ATP-binding protein [Acidobacteriota bacterium]